jgi:uncharacterized protein (TIGR00369 family)
LKRAESDPTSSPATGLATAGPMPFLKHLGIRVVEVRPGRGRLEVTVRPEHLRDLGIMHGGMTATLLDSVMGMSAAGVAPPGHDVVTIQLNMNFIRPAWEGEHLVATGEVTHSGRQTAVARAEIRTSQGILVSSGSATFFAVPHRLPSGVAAVPGAGEAEPSHVPGA